jgi:hypothetical protein
MNFTPKKFKLTPVIDGILIIAVVGLIGWGSHLASPPIMAARNSVAVEQSFPANGDRAIVPAVWTVSAPGFETARGYSYQPVTAWYKNKHWWKRNAPIVGGAGGGALVGGLLGGGKGAVVGGAVGGGGGYLYKRLRHHHEYHHHH